MIGNSFKRKIIVTIAVVFSLFLICVFPTNKTKKNAVSSYQTVEYVKIDKYCNLFLSDSNNFLAKTCTVLKGSTIIDKARELIDILIIGGKKESEIPNGFNSIIFEKVKLIDLDYDNIEKSLIVNFSKEFLDINIDNRERTLESIIYTLTGIKGVQKVNILVEGKSLDFYNPNYKKYYDRSFGINKKYDINNFKDINVVNLYYLNKYENKKYYVPITKYLNTKNDKIKIIIEELSSSPIYESNLMSFLNNNVVLDSYTIENDILNLNFNSFIFNDVNEDLILEEVIYAISYSIKDVYDVSSIVFNVNGTKILKKCLKTIE